MTFKFDFRGSTRDLKELLCNFLKCKGQSNRLRIAFGADEEIPRAIMKLTKPIKPGFRRRFTITPDEPVDKNADGQFVSVEVLTGDSTVTINHEESTARSIVGWINGDGATGEKAVRFSADGHLGDGEQKVTLDVEFNVATPDATILGFAEGPDEPIPV